MRNSECCRKLVPGMRWSMSEGSMSDFEWWRRLDQSDIMWRACVVTMRRLNRYEVIEIGWLSGSENFVSDRGDFIINSFRNFKPVKRFQNRSDVLELWSLDNSSNKSILDVLETIYLKFWKPIVQKVTVVKFGVYNGGGNCFCGVKVKVGTNVMRARMWW